MEELRYLNYLICTYVTHVVAVVMLFNANSEVPNQKNDDFFSPKKGHITHSVDPDPELPVKKNFRQSCVLGQTSPFARVSATAKLKARAKLCFVGAQIFHLSFYLRSNDNTSITMSFWGATVTSSKPFEESVPTNANLVVSHVSLAGPTDGVTTLMCTVEGTEGDFVVAHLSWGRNEQSSVDLVYPLGTDVKFTVKGKGEVHLLGMYDPIDSMGYDDSDEEGMMFGSEDSDLDASGEEDSDEALRMQYGTGRGPKIMELPEGFGKFSRLLFLIRLQIHLNSLSTFKKCWTLRSNTFQPRLFFFKFLLNFFPRSDQTTKTMKTAMKTKVRPSLFNNLRSNNKVVNKSKAVNRSKVNNKVANKSKAASNKSKVNNKSKAANNKAAKSKAVNNRVVNNKVKRERSPSKTFPTNPTRSKRQVSPPTTNKSANKPQIIAK